MGFRRRLTLIGYAETLAITALGLLIGNLPLYLMFLVMEHYG